MRSIPRGSLVSALTARFGILTCFLAVVGTPARGDVPGTNSLAFVWNVKNARTLDKAAFYAVPADTSLYDQTTIIVSYMATACWLQAQGEPAYAAVRNSAGSKFKPMVQFRPIRTLSRYGAEVLELPQGVGVSNAVAAFLGEADAEYAQPNYLVTPLAVPNDSLFTAQWGMVQANAVGAWDIETHATQVVVALVDSGIDYTHEDLVQNLWRNPDEIPADGIDNDGNGSIDDIHGISAVTGEYERDTPPWDLMGHGTHVAGIIGAVGNNSLAVAGTAWGAQIMTCRVNWRDDEIATAYEYLVNMSERGINVRIVNNSWGGWGYSTFIEDVLTDAGNHGMLLVCASGNYMTNWANYPASFTNDLIMSVTGSTSNDTQYYTWGVSNVDIAAPAVDIWSTVPITNLGDFGQVTIVTNKVYSHSGTSMATPCVAGACALLYAQRPWLRPLQVKNHLLSTVDTNASYYGKMVSNGRLNIGRALSSLASDEHALAFDSERYDPGTGPVTVKLSLYDVCVPGQESPQTIVHTSEGDTELLTLPPSAVGPGFRGQMTMRVAPITSWNGYIDIADYGSQPSITAIHSSVQCALTAVAHVCDSQAPVITAPWVSNVMDDSALVLWTNSELVSAMVEVSGQGRTNVYRDAVYRLHSSVLLTGLSAVSRYDCRAIAVDRTGNATTSSWLSFDTIAFVPVFEDRFDGGLSYWRHYGNGDCWEWGAPVSWPHRAASFPYCWGTILTGDYLLSSESKLESPSMFCPSGSFMRVSMAYCIDERFAGDWGSVAQRFGPYATQDILIVRGSNTTWSTETLPIGSSCLTNLSMVVLLKSDWVYSAPGLYIDEVRIGRWVTNGQGGVSLDRTTYYTEATAVVTVVDSDLNLDPASLDTATVTVKSMSDTVGESLLLTEAGTNSWFFTGSIPLGTNAPLAGDGLVSVAVTDRIEAVYEEATPASTHLAGAFVDGALPDMSDVQITVGTNWARISWTSSTESTGRGTCRSLAEGGEMSVASLSGFSASHSVTFSGLEPGTSYGCTLHSARENGHESNTGEFRFVTLGWREYHVNPTYGLDQSSRSGRGDSRFRTISYALARAQYNAVNLFEMSARLMLQGGTYRESLILNLPEGMKAWICSEPGYRDNGSVKSSIKGFQTVLRTTVSPPRGLRAFTIRSPGVRIEGLKIADGGRVSDRGGAILCDGASVSAEIARCFFVRNLASGDGGAIAAVNGAKPVIASSMFKDNRSRGKGGAISLNGVSGGVQIAHCTFVDNFARDNGGAVALPDTPSVANEIGNNIFVRNDVAHPGQAGKQRHVWLADGSLLSQVTNNLMYRPDGGVYAAYRNLDYAPGFRAQHNAALHLKENSAAIGQGVPLALGEVVWDIDGEPYATPPDLGADSARTNAAGVCTEMADEAATSESVSGPIDPLGDADGDGVCNLDEYLTGSDCGSADLLPAQSAEWRFDGAWVDSSGWSQDLEAHGSCAFAPGKVGRGALFQGGYATVVSTNLGLLAFPRGMTLMAWVKWNGVSALQTVLMKGHPSNPNYALHVTTGGGLRFTAGGTTVATSDGLVASGAWTHVAARAHENRYVRLYVDALPVKSAAMGQAPTNAAGVYIGSDGAGQNQWQGTLDEIVLYNRQLSEEEIARWYSLGKTIVFREAFDGEMDKTAWQYRGDMFSVTDPVVQAGAVITDDWYVATGELWGESQPNRTFARFTPGISNFYVVNYRAKLGDPTCKDIGMYLADGRYLNTLGGWDNTCSRFARCNYLSTVYGLMSGGWLGDASVAVPADRWVEVEIAHHDGEFSVSMDSNEVYTVIDPTPVFGDGLAFYTHESENAHDDLTVRRTQVGRWDFDDDLLDGSGVENHGLAPAAGMAYGWGVKGRGLSLDGCAAIEVRETGALRPCEGMTLQAWVLLHTAATNGSATIMAKYDEEPARGYAFRLVGGTPVLRLALTNAVSEISGGYVAPGHWTLLTAVWNGRVHTMSIYTNAGLAAHASGLSGNPATPASPLILGEGLVGVMDGANVFAWPMSAHSIARAANVNRPPDMPRNPYPPDGSTNQPPILSLLWACNDPDGDSLTYDVRAGTNAMALLESDVAAASVTITAAPPGVAWQWKVTGRDTHTNATDGALWTFTRSPNADWDGDGLGDEDELFHYGTDPLAKDTDGDGADDGDEVRRSTSPLDRFDRPVGILSGAMRNAQIGRPYSERLRAVGGVPPYAWEQQAGSLPPGIQAFGDGLVEGTPTATGLFSWSVRATDVRQDTTNALITIDVQPSGDGPAGSFGKGATGHGIF